MTVITDAVSPPRVTMKLKAVVPLFPSFLSALEAAIDRLASEISTSTVPVDDAPLVSVAI